MDEQKQQPTDNTAPKQPFEWRKEDYEPLAKQPLPELKGKNLAFAMQLLDQNFARRGDAYKKVWPESKHPEAGARQLMWNKPDIQRWLDIQRARAATQVVASLALLTENLLGIATDENAKPTPRVQALNVLRRILQPMNVVGSDELDGEGVSINVVVTGVLPRSGTQQPSGSELKASGDTADIPPTV